MSQQLGEPQTDLYDYVIYRCVIGSRAYGLETAASDTDRRGMYLPPAHLHWSLQGVPDQLTDQKSNDVYWEARKFVMQILKANPNVLECLYTPLVEFAAPVAEELIAMRQRFLSKQAYETYGGYAAGQFKRIASEQQRTGEVAWKDFMHLLRFLLAGVTVLEEGYVPVKMDQHRDRLLAVRDGEVPFEECDAWRVQLHQRLDLAVQKTTLPDQPDQVAANDWLIRARRSVV